MNDFGNSIFAKEHNEYTEAFKKGIKLQNIYDAVRVDAKCIGCSIYKQNEGYPQENWKSECKDKNICRKVLEANKKLTENDKAKDEIKDKYAKSVFTFFSKTKPQLLRRKDNAILSWTEVFEDDYDSLDKGLRNSLVALIEESGGKYRLV